MTATVGPSQGPVWLAAVALATALAVVLAQPASAATDRGPCASPEFLRELGLDPAVHFEGVAVGLNRDVYVGTSAGTDRMVAVVSRDRIVATEWRDGQERGTSEIHGRFNTIWIDNPKAKTEMIVQSGAGPATICTDSGDDYIELIDAANGVYVDAGPGDDTILGSRHDDVLHGRKGDDTILGHEGDDTLDGGPGSDHLKGGPGDKDACGSTGERYGRPLRLQIDTVVACEVAL